MNQSPISFAKNEEPVKDSEQYSEEEYSMDDDVDDEQP